MSILSTFFCFRTFGAPTSKPATLGTFGNTGTTSGTTGKFYIQKLIFHIFLSVKSALFHKSHCASDHPFKDMLSLTVMATTASTIQYYCVD